MTSLTERALRGALVFCVAAASLDERLTGRGNRYFFRVSSLAGHARPTTGFVESGLGARGGRPIAGPGFAAPWLRSTS